MSKLKSAAKNRTGATFRLNKKKFAYEEFPHRLFLTTRQTTKNINVFANDMSRDIKVSKTQICEMIQIGGSFGSPLANLGEKAGTNVATRSQ